MNSMTGYGKGTVTENGRELTIELKSVNNRFLEINSRLPKSMAACDDIIRRELQSRFKRGSIDVFFNYEFQGKGSRSVTVDMELAREYVKASKAIQNEFILDNDFNTTALMRSPEVLKVELSKDDPEILERMVGECVKQAADSLQKMRETEGSSIKKNLAELENNILSLIKKVADRAPLVVDEYRKKLETRIKEALAGVELDEARLLNEVAFFADKADINEEISRLLSHLSQFAECLGANEPQGRKLDFISQEMNREINTIGSKSNDTELTSAVLAMKNELEKIKEQIRNVE